VSRWILPTAPKVALAESEGCPRGLVALRNFVCLWPLRGAWFDAVSHISIGSGCLLRFLSV
jgi:hypothetical protein